MAMNTIKAWNAGDIPLEIKLKASATGNALQVKNSSGSVIFSVGPSGAVALTGALSGITTIVASSSVTAGSLILNGRLTTGSAAGSALDVSAAWTEGKGVELRWTVSAWDNLSNSFQGAYIRAQSDTDNASGVLMGMELYGVANASAVTGLKGLLSYAYIKGDTAETIDTVYAVQAEFSMDAGRANAITLTEATPLLCKVTGGKVADYTKIHGSIFRFGDMDGGSRTYGSLIYAVDDAAMSGTSALGNIIYTDLTAAYFLNASATAKAGLDTTIAGQTVGTINCVVKCKFGSTDFWLYGYAGKPT